MTRKTESLSFEGGTVKKKRQNIDIKVKTKRIKKHKQLQRIMEKITQIQRLGLAQFADTGLQHVRKNVGRDVEIEVLLSQAAVSCKLFIGGFGNDLLLKLLSTLRFTDLCRLRTTCRSFNKLLTSRAFWRELLPVGCNARRSCSVVLMMRPGLSLSSNKRLEEFFIYINEDLNKLKAGKLVPLLNFCNVFSPIGDPTNLIVPTPSPYYDSVMAASSGGLLCFMLVDESQGFEDEDVYSDNYNRCVGVPFHIVVLNPLTRSSTKLPPVPETRSQWSPGCKSLLFDVDETTSPPSYFVVLVYGMNETKIYHSRTGSWTLARFQQKQTNSLRTIQHAPFFRYGPFLNTNHLVFERQLHAYDTVSSMWWYLPIKNTCLDEIRAEGRMSIVFRHRGRILFACLLCCESESPQTNELQNQGFKILELKQTESCGYWNVVELSRTPTSCWSKLLKWDTLFAGDGLVYAVSVQDPDFQGNYPGSETSGPCQPLVYDIDNDFWYFLPDYEDGKPACGNAVAISYVEPALYLKP